jgi:hypothetical protein
MIAVLNRHSFESLLLMGIPPLFLFSIASGGQGLF